jgi:hypothetical protein
MNIGDKMWHPCSLDIIEHKVIGINQFEDCRGKLFKHYTLKAVNNIGACGRLEVIIDEHKNKFRFVELLNEENIEYASGLQDFIEGNYYNNKEEAELEFYELQKSSARSSVWKYEQFLKEAQSRLRQIESLIKVIKESKKNNNQIK